MTAIEVFKIKKKTGPKPKMDGIIKGECIINKKFKHLLVLKEVLPRMSGKHPKRRVSCVCDCGKYIDVDVQYLLNGDTKSCGCIKSRRIIETHTTHGLTAKISEYAIWQLMRRRCNSPKDSQYNRYGGRGISICSRWGDFMCFLSDMGRRPSKNHSIDRIDNNGNYEPSNCRWATKKEQSNNCSNNVIVYFMGEKMTLKQFSERINMKYTTVITRLKFNWSIEKIASTPVKSRK